MGDISAVMPAIHVYAAGAEGHGHGADYFITDPDKACLGTTRCLLLTAKALLENGAEKANAVVAQAHPVFADKEDYFKLMDSMFLDQEAITYEDGGASICWK